MSLEAPPPSRHLSSKPISTADASRMLETYLTNSESHPHLHPDALITPTGVTFSSHGGPMGSVIMHNLRRVAAGLRGEYLEPEKTPEPEENEGDGSGRKKFNKKGARKARGASIEADSDWQDRAEYEREEGFVEVGEIAPRSNFVQEGGEEPEVEVLSGVEEEGRKKRKKGAEDGKVDKAARKKAKKERNEQRKRENEKKNAGQA